MKRIHVPKYGALFVCSTLLVSACAALAEQDIPTSAEFVALQKKLAKQFTTVKATTKIDTFRIQEGKVAAKPVVRIVQTSRWSPESGFVKNERESFDKEGEGKYNPGVYTYIFSNRPKRSRSFAKGATLRPQGIVQKEPFVQAQQPYDPVQMSLGIVYSVRLDHYPVDKATTHAGNEGQVVYDVMDNNTEFTAIVDKKYGYMPIIVELKQSDGTLQERYTFEDFREVSNGCWLPFQYTRQIKIANLPDLDGTLDKITVLDVEVNKPIPDSDFQLVYEPGTEVKDTIAGITYTIGK